MSLDPLWAESLQKAITQYFYSFNLGVPWELEREIEGDKVSLTFLNPKIKRVGRDSYLESFTIRIVCTISTEGLYDLSTISGKASALLLNAIEVDGKCISPQDEDVSIDLFDFKNGYKQSLMEQVYTSR